MSILRDVCFRLESKAELQRSPVLQWAELQLRTPKQQLRDVAQQLTNIASSSVQMMVDGKSWGLPTMFTKDRGLSNITKALTRFNKDEKLTHKLFMSGKRRKVWTANALIYPSRQCKVWSWYCTRTFVISLMLFTKCRCNTKQFPLFVDDGAS